MKHHTLFSLKDKIKKKCKCHLLQFLFGTLRVKCIFEFRVARIMVVRYTAFFVYCICR